MNYKETRLRLFAESYIGSVIAETLRKKYGVDPLRYQDWEEMIFTTNQELVRQKKNDFFLPKLKGMT